MLTASQSTCVRTAAIFATTIDRIIVDHERAAIQLTEKETQVLRYLFRARGRPVSKQELLVEVWGYSSKVNSHTVETHVYRLRQKIERLSQFGCVLRTEEKGYSLLSSIPERVEVIRIRSLRDEPSIQHAPAFQSDNLKAAAGSRR